MPVRETLYLDVSPALANLKVLDAAAAKVGVTMGTGLANASKQLSTAQLGTKLSGFGTTLTRNVTTPIAAAGAASIFFASQFESSMAKIVGLSGLSAKSVENLKSKVLDLAGQTAIAPKELADALYFITSSGFSGAAAMDVLQISAKAAAAGLGETQIVADALTSVISAYGRENITAARAADILTASVKFGKAEADQLAAGIGNLAPLASQLGVSFEDVGASIAAMTMVGVDVDTAFTNMSAIFSGLLKVTPQTADALASVGLNAADLRDTIKQPGGVLVALREIDTAFQGNEEAMAAVFPNIRALRGVMSLLAQNGAEVDKVFRGVTNSTGTMDHAFDTAAKTSAFKFKQGLADLQVVAIELGNKLIPIATQIVGVVSDMAAAFSSLPDWAQTFIIGAAAAAAAVGPILKVTGALLKMRVAMATVAALQGAGGAGGAAGATGLLAGLAVPAAVITSLVVAGVVIDQTIGSAGQARREGELWTKGWKNLAKVGDDELIPMFRRLRTVPLEGGMDLVLPKYKAFEKLAKDSIPTAQRIIGLWEQQGQSTGRYSRILNEVIGRQAGVNQASATYMTTMGQLGAALAANGATLDRNTAAGQANRTIMVDSTAAAFQLAASYTKQDGDAGRAAASVLNHARALETQMRQAGFTDAAIQNYLHDLGLTPAQIATTLKLDDAGARAALKGYLNDIGIVDKKTVTTILKAVKEGDANTVQDYINFLNLTPEQKTTVLDIINLADPQLRAQIERLNLYDGIKANADIGVTDNATPVIDPAQDKLNIFGTTISRAQVLADDETAPAFDTAAQRASAWTNRNPRAQIDATDNSGGPFTTAFTKADTWTARNPITVLNAADGTEATFVAANNKASAWAGLNPSTSVGANDGFSTAFGNADGKASAWTGRNPSTNIIAHDQASPVINAVDGRRIADKHFNIIAHEFSQSSWGLAKGGVVGHAMAGGMKHGLTLVGENGPELTWLPRGSRVIPAAESKRALRGAGVGGGLNIGTVKVEVLGPVDVRTAPAVGQGIANGLFDGLTRRKIVLAGRG